MSEISILVKKNIVNGVTRSIHKSKQTWLKHIANRAEWMKNF